MAGESSCVEGVGEFVVGIDLGTSNCCVGVWIKGRLEIVLDEEGNRIVPSYVAFADDEILVGNAAKSQASANPKNTIFGIKHLIGRKFSDEAVQAKKSLWPFEVVEGDNDALEIVAEYNGELKRYPPQEILSMIFSKLKKSAEINLKQPIKKAVLTVPAYFDHTQREATKSAATNAGLEILEIINEPTAAAIAYGLDQKKNDGSDKKRNVLIFHMGGSTIAASLVEIQNLDVEVKATTVDPNLGGHDFTDSMVKHFVEVFRDKQDITNIPKSISKLRKACETAKMLLQVEGTDAVAVEVESLYKGIDLLDKITRLKFEELNMDLYNKCLDPVKECLEKAGMSNKDVEEVVLVGGSCRDPKIWKMLGEFFVGKKLCNTLHPEEAVACGAAILGAKHACQANANVPQVVTNDEKNPLA